MNSRLIYLVPTIFDADLFQAPDLYPSRVDSFLRPVGARILKTIGGTSLYVMEWIAGDLMSSQTYKSTTNLSS